MAITLTVTGNGHFQGAATNLSGYSATEDSTPIDPSDSSGGTGQTTFSLVEDSGAEGSILLRGDTVELEDGSNGRTRGLVSAVGGNDGALSLTADSRLNALVVDITLGAYAGTLDGVFRYYLAAAGITAGIVVDSTIAARAIAAPAISGNLWDNVKKLCSAQQVEVSLVSSNIVMRPLRGRVVETVKNSTESWSVADGDLAQTVEVYYYNNVYKANGLVFPSDEVAALSNMQIGTGELSVVTLTTSTSIQDIQQPVPVADVERYYKGTASVYCVVDSKGVAVDPLVWSAAGGSITVAVGDDFKSLIVTVAGPSLTEDSPYRIESVNGHQSLRIVGSGVFTDPMLLTIPTGAPAALAPQLVGITVQNTFINTLSDAYGAGMLAAGRYCGAKQTIDVTATVINRKNERGYINYPTFSVFDADWAGKTFAQFNTAKTGQLFSDLTATYYSQVADTFENQAFGNVAGARVRFRMAWYRIRSATVSHGTISYSGERDTLFSDFSSLWGTGTFAAFNTRMSGKTFADFGVIPLWQ